MKNIKTGVDRLVEIISDAKKISLDEAASKLKVSPEVVQEWADFLEKEKLVTIEYSFSKVWLLERKLSKKEIKNVAKEISSEKDAFSRKIDSALKSLETETVGFEELKKQFVKIQGNVKQEIDEVERQLAELERYDRLKKNIDKNIEQQKVNYAQAITDIISRIKKDQEIIS